MPSSPSSIVAPKPLRKHYGFAIFRDGAELATHLEIAAHLKQTHLNTYITWFASEQNVTIIRQSTWVDQVVVLPGNPINLEQEVERLRHDRPWIQFYPQTSIEVSNYNFLNTLNSSSLPVLSPCPKPPHHLGAKILLGQLGMNGDCLYATTLARQIKQDFPNSHLTWAISSACRSVIEENPYVDQIWEIHAQGWPQIAATWSWLVHEARHQIAQNRFDHVFLTQVYPDNSHNFDGTARPSLFRAYPGKITVPVQNIIRLRREEIENVSFFAKKHNLFNKKPVILFEHTFSSLQSYLDHNYVLEMCRQLLEYLPNCSIILSSNRSIISPDPRVIDGSTLSLRENAELTKYCDLFIGCSSGITQVALSDWAKPLPMIQLLSSSTPVFASIAHDLKYWGISTDTIIEMDNASIETVVKCVIEIFQTSFSNARKKFHRELKPNFQTYVQQIRDHTLSKGLFASTLQALLYTVKRYGWQPELKTFLQKELFPLRNMRSTLPISDSDCEQFLTSCFKTASQDTYLPELPLKAINLICFPDWQQPLEMTCQTLGEIVKAIITHPQSEEITLLIVLHNISSEEANMLLSEAIVHVVFEQQIEITTESEIEILPWLDEYQWGVLLPLIQGRLVLPNEDQHLIEKIGAEVLLDFNLGLKDRDKN